MKRSLGAKSLVLVVVSIATIVMVAVGTIATTLLVSSMRQREADRYASVLIKSLTASLQNDLLSSNILVATDRARSFFTSEAEKWLCFTIQQAPLDSTSSSRISVGNSDICVLPNSSELVEHVYYDADQKQVAFILDLKYLPEKFPFSISGWGFALPGIVLIFALVVVVALAGLIQRLLNGVNSILLEGNRREESIFGFQIKELTQLEAVLNELKVRREQRFETELMVRRSEAIREIAAQLSHDIRSPLSALNMVVSHLGEVPSEKRDLIVKTARRINDIANGLLKKDVILDGSVTTSLASSPFLVQDVIKRLIEEKRIELDQGKLIRINFKSELDFGTFVSVPEVDFSRMLSNLINNSIEAYFGKLLDIEVKLSSSGSDIILEISDNGKGIPKDVLSKIGERGFSFGKHTSLHSNSGTGLGLFSSFQIVSAVHGSIKVSSDLGEGTTVTIQLPRTDAPGWFADHIDLNSKHKIIIVDDDVDFCFHVINRLKVEFGISDNEIQAFHSAADFRESVDRYGPNTAFIFDFDLNDYQNGLQLIVEFGLQNKSTLLTSNFDSDLLQERAIQAGVRIAPKPYFDLIKIIR